MQDDKTLFTEKVPAGKRTYFLDVKENHQGTQVLKITESRKNNGEFVRHSIMVFQEDFDKLFDALQSVKQFIQDNPSSQPNRTYPNPEQQAPAQDFKEEDLSF